MRRRQLAAAIGAAVGTAGCGTLGQVRLPKQPARRRRLLRPSFDADEREAIDRGTSVTRDVVFAHGYRKYIGAISAVIVRTWPEQALRAMMRIESVRNWLPFNHRADVVAERGDELVIELVQGVDPFLATFSVRVRPDDGVIHVELDPDRRHDIDDLWAFIAARRYDAQHTLVTYGIAVDVGHGALRLIEKEVQSTFSWIIDDIRTYLEGGPDLLEAQPVSSRQW